MIKSYKYNSLIKLQKLVENNIISEDFKNSFEQKQELISVNNVHTFIYNGVVSIYFLETSTREYYKVYSKTRNPYVKIQYEKRYLSDMEHMSDDIVKLSTDGVNNDLEYKEYNIGIRTQLAYSNN